MVFIVLSCIIILNYFIYLHTRYKGSKSSWTPSSSAVKIRFDGPVDFFQQSSSDIRMWTVYYSA